MAEEAKQEAAKPAVTKPEEGTPHTYEQLKHMTVAQLRAIAKGNEHEALKGYTQLNKDHLITALCKALNITRAHHDVVGVDKTALKTRLKALKKEREAALAAHDHAKLKAVRRHMHRINHIIRSHTV
jgi:hypothetical protein